MKKTNLLFAFLVSGLLLLSGRSYGQFNGAYTIDTTKTNTFGTSNPSGSVGNYMSFARAAWAIMKYGVTGPVVFNVAPNTYTENVQLWGAASGASATNTITFQSAGGDSSSVILTSSNATALTNVTMVIYNANFYVFKKLTIQNTNSTFGTAINNR
jgi:hypothetical protein